MAKSNRMSEAAKKHANSVNHVELDRLKRKADSDAQKQKLRDKQYQSRIEELERLLEIKGALDKQKKPKSRKKVPIVKSAGATAIAVLSDWHVEELIKPEKVNGLNEFTLEIAKQRAKQTFDKILLLIEHERKLVNVRTLCLALLGDFISGYIHDELVEGNQLHPIDATFFAAGLLEEGIQYLLDHGDLDQIVIPTCNGNHGRTTAKRRVATYAENSYEYGMYRNMRSRMTDKRLVWQVGEGYHNWVEIQGYKCRMHHGDSIRYQGGVGGISIPVNKAIAMWNKSIEADYDFFGHYHTYMQQWNWCSNGSLIGYGPYSLEIKGEYQPPVQTLAIMDRDRGLTKAMPIYCDIDRRKAMRRLV